MAKRAVTPEDLLQLKFLDEVVPSPDGTRAVITIRTIDAEKDTYASHLWLVPLQGGGEPRQLTFGEHKNFGAAWRPDGKAVAFVSTRADKKPQIHRLPLEGGEAERLTELDGDLGGLEWSPDGSSIAFTYRPADPPETGHLAGSAAERKALDAKREKKDPPPPTFRHVTRMLYKMDGEGWLPRGRSHVHVLDVATRKTRAVTSGDFDHGPARWSPDGRWLAFAANRQEDEEYSSYAVSDIYVVPVSGGEPRNLTPQPGIASAPSWSPDGTRIAFLGHDRPDDWWGVPNYHVWVVPVTDGKEQDLLPGFDRYAGDLTGTDLRDFHASGNPVWSRDGKSLYFQVSEEGSTHLYSVPAAGGAAPKRLTPDPMQILTAARGRDQDDLVVIRCDHTDAGTVARLDPSRGTFTPLVTPNHEFFGNVALVEPEEFWVDAPDGHRVQAWMLKPPGADRSKRHPMILQIHGGPRVQYGACLYFEFQVLANAGFYVLFSNPRGSQGYGETFTKAIVHDWAAPAFDDLMRVVDAALVRYPEIDPERLGVTGGSYGGYMTNWVVSHTDRFQAAITQRCVTTIPTLLLGDDLMPLATPEFGAEPWEDAEILRRQSPLSYVEKIRTPLLITHSLMDQRCDPTEAEMLYKALKALRREVEMVLFPEESHGLSRKGTPSRRVARLHLMRDWFVRYLAPAGAPEPRTRVASGAEPALAGTRRLGA
ncbi:MAG TPA: S9 family peptidase [Candidatus Eisenbacteria bacterium]